MTTPPVSVCIPTFNMGAFIGQAVDSVLAQSVQDFAIVRVRQPLADGPCVADVSTRWRRRFGSGRCE